MTAKPLPAPASHAPLSILNHTGTGIRTMVTCSCGATPAKAPASMSVLNNSHMAHRRKLGFPRADYTATVFGEGPWTGWTWDEQYKQRNDSNRNLDPYTGNPR
jgi:hypothetical protein